MDHQKSTACVQHLPLSFLPLAFDRLLYGTTKGHKDMVHHEKDDFNRQGESLQKCTDSNAIPIYLYVCTKTNKTTVKKISISYFRNMNCLSLKI